MRIASGTQSICLHINWTAMLKWRTLFQLTAFLLLGERGRIGSNVLQLCKSNLHRTTCVEPLSLKGIWHESDSGSLFFYNVNLSLLIINPSLELCIVYPIKYSFQGHALCFILMHSWSTQYQPCTLLHTMYHTWL